MTAYTVVVAHREAMLAEGIAATLARCPGIVPVGSAKTPGEVIRLGERADAVAIDTKLPGAERASGALRRRGVRVVFLGTEPSADGSVKTKIFSKLAVPERRGRGEPPPVDEWRR